MSDNSLAKLNPVILKVLKRQEPEALLDSMGYWKRELLLVQSGLLDKGIMGI